MRGFLLALLVLAIPGASTRADTYYVDPAAGDDGRAGTSPTTAWRSFERVNATTFLAGDRILLRSGGAFTGPLKPRGSGAEGRPIVVDTWGPGPKALVRGDGSVAAVLLEDQEHWEIRNLEVTNEAPRADFRRGVLVRANGRPLRHIHLVGLDVHHVTGTLGAGMPEKRTGGIGIEALGAAPGTRFEDVLVERCTVRSVDSTGIYTFAEGATHPRDPEWSRNASTGVRIRANRLSDIGKNAIVVRSAEAPVIDDNVIEGAASRLHGNAIFVFGCRNARIEQNEVSGTRFHGLEGAAFDSDYNCEGTVIQYNYSHDNGGGLVNLCANPGAGRGRGYNDGTVVRYNVSRNESSRVIAFDGPATNTRIYNNTIHVGRGFSPCIVEFDTFGRQPGYASGVAFWNNAIYNEGGGDYAWGGATGVWFEANGFFGNHPAAEPPDGAKVTGDPGFVDPRAAGRGRASVEGYRLRAGSPCIDSGRPVPEDGGRDLLGAPLVDGRPDLGAIERTGGEPRLDGDPSGAPRAGRKGANGE